MNELVSCIKKFGTTLGTLHQFDYQEVKIKDGDAFQIITQRPEKTLLLAVLFRTYIMKKSKEITEKQHDVRIAIGLGAVNTNADDIQSMNCPALTNSGRLIKGMKKADRMRCHGCWGDIMNSILDDYTRCASAIMDTWTSKQLDVCYYMLLYNNNRKVVIEKFGNELTHQRLSQYLKYAHYELLEDIIKHFEQIVTSHLLSC